MPQAAGSSFLSNSRAASAGGWEPQAMKGRYYNIAKLAALGMNQTEIAKAVQMTPVAVSMIVRSPLVKEEVARLLDLSDGEYVDLVREIELLSPAALGVVAETMINAPKAETRLKAATEILDRNPQTSKHTTVTKRIGRVTDEVIAGWKRQAVESARSQGLLAEAQVLSMDKEEVEEDAT